MRAARGPEADPPGATVFIGLKPTMTYVFQVVTQINSGSPEVIVRARGNAIAKAVDVVEVVRRRFLEGQVELGSIAISTERLVNRDGRDANVSAIAIPIRRVGPPPGAPATGTRPPPAAGPPSP
ncbi:MAG TPA: DNA-binding protein Alba [Thermoplasmata archaeon]|nr:DNA-binding protein Alba [Thermoplasmata archaeon]